VAEQSSGDSKYSLGEPAASAYSSLMKNREQVCEMGRMMAELTIPSVFPPDGYQTGDDIPGNNQSFNAQCVNNLASRLMFMAFPPGQPIMELDPVVQKLQKDIQADPQMYAQVLLALSQLERAHRKRFQSTPLATAYVGYMKLLIVAGNALWKHIKLDSPTYHKPNTYVVSRARDGHPLVTIHEEVVRVVTLDEDIQDLIYRETPGLLEESNEWEREVKIYSVCQLKVDGKERTWCYWQEYEGNYIEDTGVETEYNAPPMWPGWMIPVYGSNWGRSYCEEYRGDLFTAEAHASGINDIAALSAWALTFVKPGTRTSLRQVQKARNLDVLSGSAEDLSVFRAEKSGDANMLSNTLEATVRRLGAAFLMDSATMRTGERVTKEEIVRVGNQLDRAMGGIYTEIAQGHQKRILMRAIRLHEEEDNALPPIPDGVVDVSVVTGIDAMGRSSDAAELREYGADINATFGPGAAAQVLDINDYATRLAAARGIKPDGLVKTKEQVQQGTAEQQQMMAQQTLVEKGTAPMAGALADTIQQGASALMNPQQPPAQE
jgi:hypothetical protein